MKKYLPFVITGVLSAGISLGIFSILFKPSVLVEAGAPMTVFTNYSPFDYTSSISAPPGSSDLVKGANIAK